MTKNTRIEAISEIAPPSMPKGMGILNTLIEKFSTRLRMIALFAAGCSTTQPEAMREMAAAAERSVAGTYSTQAMVERVEKLYLGLINRES